MAERTIVIIGMGVAGAECARTLARYPKQLAKTRIILVDRFNHSIVHNTLYGIAALDKKRELVSFPIRPVLAHRPFEFLEDTVVAIDPIRQTVNLHQAGTIEYDYLVTALGSIPDSYGIPGLADYAHQFHSLDDALRIRETLRHLSRKQQSITVVIGGGGYTGTELAAALAGTAQRHLRGLARLRVCLIEQASQLLSGQPRRLAQITESVLRQRQIELYYNQGIKRVRRHQIILANDRAVPFDLFIWTGGNRANPLLAKAGLSVDQKGRVIVNRTMQAHGFSRTYVLGDASAFATDKKETLPATAPHAIHQGRLTAENIIRQMRGELPLPYRPGSYPSILIFDQRDGILLMGKIVIRSRFVVLIRQLVEINYLSYYMSLFRAWSVVFPATRKPIGRLS